MLELKKMRSAEFEIFNEANIELLADFFNNDLGQDADEAVRKAETEQEEALTGGADTEGQYLFSILDDGVFLGGLWFSELERKGVALAFLFCIWIKPEYRGTGAGIAAMRLLETEVKNIGLDIIRLHVLKKNKTALSVYYKSGYSLFTDYDGYDENGPGIIMEKRLN